MIITSTQFSVSDLAAEPGFLPVNPSPQELFTRDLETIPQHTTTEPVFTFSYKGVVQLLDPNFRAPTLVNTQWANQYSSNPRTNFGEYPIFVLTYEKTPGELDITSHRKDRNSKTFIETPGIKLFLELNPDTTSPDLFREDGTPTPPSVVACILTQKIIHESGQFITTSPDSRYLSGCLIPSDANSPYAIMYRNKPYTLRPIDSSGTAIQFKQRGISIDRIQKPTIHIQDPRNIRGQIYFGTDKKTPESASLSVFQPVVYGGIRQLIMGSQSNVELPRRYTEKSGIKLTEFDTTDIGCNRFLNTWYNQVYSNGYSSGMKITETLTQLRGDTNALFTMILLAQYYIQSMWADFDTSTRVTRGLNPTRILNTLRDLNIDPQKAFSNPNDMQKAIDALGIWYEVVVKSEF